MGDVMSNDQEQFDTEVMQELWHIQFGTAEEARGDYDYDVQRQRELDDAKPNRC